MIDLGKTIQDLKKARVKEPVISFYLTFQPAEDRQTFLTRIHSQLIQQKKSLSNQPLRSPILKLLNQIQDFLEEQVDIRGIRTLVIFAASGFWQVLKLPIKLEDHLVINGNFHLTPLLLALEETPTTMIVVVDRNQAQILILKLGQIVFKSAVLTSDVPQKIQARGYHTGREDKILRHIEVHLNRHFGKIIEGTKPQITQFQPRFLVLAGEKEILVKFRKLLPKAWQAKVIGQFSANVSTPQNQLVRQANQIVDQKVIETERQKLL